MTDLGKVQPVHRQRAACVYIRQSTPHQVEHHPKILSCPCRA